ncbi:unnamed protein product [Closterium sp. NIES-54]
MDLAAGHAAALRRIFMCQAGGCDVYNLGTGKGTTVLEMVAGFERACGQKLPVKLCPRRPGDCSEVFASTDKAQQDLDWRATRTVEDMCRDQWNWARQNPMGYAADEDSEEGEESGGERGAVNGIGSLGVFKSRGMGCRKVSLISISPISSCGSLGSLDDYPRLEGQHKCILTSCWTELVRSAGSTHVATCRQALR